MQKRSTRGAFTLIEMLVVVGIIALIISILLPSLIRARKTAQGIQCMSNIHQIKIGMNMYEAENKGYSSTDFNTIFAIYRNNQNVALSGSAFFGFRYCPAWAAAAADAGQITTNGGGLGGSYGFNPWISGVFGATSPLPAKLGTIRDASEVALLGDVIYTSSTGFNYVSVPALADPFGEDRMSAANLTLFRPSFHGRHPGGGAILWLDGHTTLEMPTPVPQAATFTAGQSLEPVAFYNSNHIGYLTPPLAKVNSVPAEYYFIANKRLLSDANGGGWFVPYITTSGIVFYPNIDDWH